MSRKIDLNPGAVFVPQAGDKVRLLPGVHEPIRFAAPDVEIFGAEGPGDSVIDGKRKAEFGIRAMDGAHRPYVHTLTLKNCGHGLRFTELEQPRLEDLISEGHAVEGFHVAGVSDLQARRLITRNTGLWKFQSYGPDQSHGFYLAGDSDGATIEDLLAENVGGSLLQVNGAASGHVITRVAARRLLARTCGRGGSGTLAFAFMGVMGALVEFARLEDANGIATLFDDGKGEELAAFDCTFRAITLVNTPAVFKQENGSVRNTFSRGTGWQEMPAPPGGAPPPPDPGDLQSRLDAALARATASDAEVARLKAQAAEAATWYRGAPAGVKG